MSRATRLGAYESYFGDARSLATELNQYMAVTHQAIQDAVKKYLGPDRRQLVEVVPIEAPPAPPAAPKTDAAKGGKP